MQQLAGSADVVGRSAQNVQDFIADAKAKGIIDQIHAGTGIPWALKRPGDLIFFSIAGTSRIDHVGLLADVNADGAWDLIHAASPELGVRVDYNVFGSAYYQSRIRGFRTAR